MPSEVKVLKRTYEGRVCAKLFANPSFDFRPDLVVLNTGGNYIRAASSLRTIYKRVLNLAEQFQQNSMKTVYVCEIAEIGCFS